MNPLSNDEVHVAYVEDMVNQYLIAADVTVHVDKSFGNVQAVE